MISKKKLNTLVSKGITLYSKGVLVLGLAEGGIGAGEQISANLDIALDAKQYVALAQQVNKEKGVPIDSWVTVESLPATEQTRFAMLREQELRHAEDKDRGNWDLIAGVACIISSGLGVATAAVIKKNNPRTR